MSCCIWCDITVWGAFVAHGHRSVGDVTLTIPGLGDQVLCTTGASCLDDVSFNASVTLALVDATSGQVIAQEVYSTACSNSSARLLPTPPPGPAGDLSGGGLRALDVHAALQSWLAANSASSPDQTAFQRQVACTVVVSDDSGRETRQHSPPRSVADLRPCEFTLSTLTIDDYATEPSFQVGDITFRYVVDVGDSVGPRVRLAPWRARGYDSGSPSPSHTKCLWCALPRIATAIGPHVTRSSRQALLHY